MTSLEIAKSNLGITESSGLLVDRLNTFVEIAEAYVWEMTDMNEERFNSLDESRKLFYTVTVAEVAQYFYNISAKNGIQSQTDGVTNTSYLTDLPKHIKQMIGRFRCRI